MRCRCRWVQARRTTLFCSNLALNFDPFVFSCLPKSPALGVSVFCACVVDVDVKRGGACVTAKREKYFTNLLARAYLHIFTAVVRGFFVSSLIVLFIVPAQNRTASG